MATQTVVPSGWYPDPVHRHQYRFWSGTRWADLVSDNAVTATDPFPAAPKLAGTVAPGAAPVSQTTAASVLTRSRQPVATPDFGVTAPAPSEPSPREPGPIEPEPSEPGPKGSGPTAPEPAASGTTPPAPAAAPVTIAPGYGQPGGPTGQPTPDEQLVTYRKAYRKRALRQAGLGLGIFLIGLIITATTYSNAASNPSGGTYFVAYGPMLLGAIWVIGGLVMLVKQPTRLPVPKASAAGPSRVTVTCSICKGRMTLPGTTKRAVCTSCGAIGRWFRCTSCHKTSGVWSKQDLAVWKFTCPQCGSIQHDAVEQLGAAPSA